MTVLAETIEIFRNFVLICVGVVGIYVSLAGLGAWRRELRGKKEYEVAYGLLEAVFKVERQIKSARHPLMSISELKLLLKEEGRLEKEISEILSNLDEDSVGATVAVYQWRLNRVSSSFDSFRLKELEAEVLWVVGLVG